MTPEQRLWQAVLGQAISDAMMEDPQTLKSMMDKKSARFWFDFADRNFRLVCEMAGMNPDAVSEAWRDGRVSRAGGLRQPVLHK